MVGGTRTRQVDVNLVDDRSRAVRHDEDVVAEPDRPLDGMRDEESFLASLITGITAWFPVAVRPVPIAKPLGGTEDNLPSFVRPCIGLFHRSRRGRRADGFYPNINPPQLRPNV